MKNQQIISHSVVLLEKDFNGQILPNQNMMSTNAGKFDVYCNQGLLKLAMKDVFKQDLNLVPSIINPIVKTFNFDNVVVFQNILMPPRFIIQHNIDSTDMSKIKELFNLIVIDGDEEAKKIISVVGVNISLFVANEDFDIKKAFFVDKVKKDLGDISLNFKYITNNIPMTIQMSQGQYKDVNGALFNVNYHNDMSIVNIENIFDVDFFELFNSKIDILLP